ncbi:hypothetical protein AB0L44_17025 [Nonomuraea wenchangensis]|uniref:hypothetical protein n=1 Tax=Nonomuraea wenchangensis TaxID=568860 RepID=UPI0034400F1A
MRIVTGLRAAVARHRFGRTAVVVAALYLAGCAAAAAYGGMLLLGPLATGSLWWRPDDLWPLLAAACGFNAWLLWQALRGPALPRAGAPARPVVWLRRLLYVDVAGELLLWELADRLSGPAEFVVRQAVWAATLVLLVRTISGVTPRFRVIAIGLGLGGVLAAVMRLAPGDLSMSWSLLLAPAAKAMILTGQRRDGRWSAATVRIGWIALLAPSAFTLSRVALGHGEGLVFDGLHVVADVLGGLGIVWAARTANELAAPPAAAPPPAGSRPPRSLVAAVLMLPMAVVGAEQGVRLTYTGTDDGCAYRIRPAAAGGPEERRRSFLCLARQETFAGGTMFPEDLPDQRILARAEKLCAQAGDSERMALHRRDGRGQRPLRRPLAGRTGPPAGHGRVLAVRRGRLHRLRRPGRDRRRARPVRGPRGRVHRRRRQRRGRRHPRRPRHHVPDGQGLPGRPAAPADRLGRGGRGRDPQSHRPAGRAAVPRGQRRRCPWPGARPGARRARPLPPARPHPAARVGRGRSRRAGGGASGRRLPRRPGEEGRPPLARMTGQGERKNRSPAPTHR